MDRIHFKPITDAHDWAEAREWAVQRRHVIREGMPTWWIVRGEKRIGVTQRAMVPVLGLYLDEDQGKASESVRIIDGLRNWAQLANEDPLVLTHADSAMGGLHERMLTSLGDNVRGYWLRKED